MPIPLCLGPGRKSRPGSAGSSANGNDHTTREPRKDLKPVVALDIAKEISKNILMAFPPVRRARCRFRRTSTAPDVSLLDRYAYPLLRRAETVGSIRGADVFEIGPGDNLCSGLAFLAGGARSYTCADRFPGNY